MAKNRKKTKGKGKGKEKDKQRIQVSAIRSSESTLSGSDITFTKQRKAKPKEIKDLIQGFIEQEEFLLENLEEFNLETHKSCLSALIDLCKQFLPIKASVETEWKKRRPAQRFPDCLQQALQTTITRIGKVYAEQSREKEGIDFLVELELKLETEIKEFARISEVREILHCELGNAYCNINEYDNALYTFEKITSESLKKYLMPLLIANIAEYLFDLITHDLLDENPIDITEVRITSELAQLESKKRKNAVKIQEIEGRLGQPIFKLIEKYVEYAIEVSRQEKAMDVLFIANSVLFRIAAVEGKSDFYFVKNRFEQTLKAFPDENQLKEISEEQRGELFFKRAIINKTFKNYMRRLGEKDVGVNDRIILCEENWQNDLHVSAQLGFAQAQSFASIFLLKDKNSSRQWQQRAAAGGDVSACYNEAHDLIHEDNGLNDANKLKKIFYLLKKSVEAGHVPSLYKLGEIYSGYFAPCLIETDYSKAVEYYQRAAEYNDPNAWRELGRIILKRGRPDDIVQALALWQQAKNYNNIGSMLLLASSLSIYIDHLIQKKQKQMLSVQTSVYWPRVVISYVAQGIMHCQDAIIQLNKESKDSLEQNKRDEQKKHIYEACAILDQFSKLLENDIFFSPQNKAVKILCNKISAILENVPMNVEFSRQIGEPTAIAGKIENEESDDAYFDSLDRFFTQFVALTSVQEDLALVDDATQPFNSNPYLDTLFEIYPIFKSLDNTALTLYEISGIFWSAGSEHHRLFNLYKQDVQILFENLLIEIEKLSLADFSPYVLSCLCKALLGLGRLRLNADEPLVRQMTAAIIGKIAEHIESVFITNKVDMICALSFFPFQYSLDKKLLELLIIYLQNDSEQLSFIEISQICYTLSIIDANRAVSSQVDSTAEIRADLIIKINEAVIPHLLQPQPFVYLHQWVLAIDYFMHSKPELVVSLKKLPQFIHKYDHIYNSRKQGNPSHFQERVSGYVNSIFKDSAKEEFFFGLLAGDLFVSVSDIPANIVHTGSDLLFEVNGPTHFNCNSFQNDETILSPTTRDIFHHRYKELLHAKKLCIISIPFTLAVERRKEREAIIEHIYSQFGPVQPQSLSGFSAQIFLPPPRVMPSTQIAKASKRLDQPSSSMNLS